MIHRIPDYTYEDCTVLRWVDGDTVDLKVRAHFDMGFKVVVSGEYTGRFRLYGIDAFERNHPRGSTATEFCKAAMPVGSEVDVVTWKDPDNFGRYIAELTAPGTDMTISAKLLTVGLAVPYSGRIK